MLPKRLVDVSGISEVFHLGATSWASGVSTHKERPGLLQGPRHRHPAKILYQKDGT
jgi:hypothetical protein